MAIEETLTQPQEQARRGSLFFLGKVVNLSGSQVARRAFRFLVMLIAARQLGPSTFGLYAMLFTVTEFVSLLSGAGFGDFVTRETAIQPESTRHLLFRLFLLRLFYVACFTGFEVAVLGWLGYSSQVRLYALIFALTLPARSLAELCQGFIKSSEQFHKLPKIEFCQGFVALGASGALAYKNLFTLPSLLWIEVASAVVGAAVTFAIVHSLLPGRSQGSALDWTRVLKATFVFNVYPLIVNAYDRFDVVLLSRLVSNAAAGTYAFPYRFLAILNILPFGLTGVLFPRMARLQGEKEQAALCRYLLTVLFFSSLLLVLVMFFCSDLLAGKLLTSAYTAAGRILRVLVWAAIPGFLNYGFNTILLSRRRERIFIVIALVCLIFNLGANLLFIPRFSYMAAAWVTVATEMLLLVQNLVILWRSPFSLPFPRGITYGLVSFTCALFAGKALASLMPLSVAGILVAGVFAALAWPKLTYSNIFFEAASLFRAVINSAGDRRTARMRFIKENGRASRANCLSHV